jgi:hypothetical protein
METGQRAALELDLLREEMLLKVRMLLYCFLLGRRRRKKKKTKMDEKKKKIAENCWSVLKPFV